MRAANSRLSQDTLHGFFGPRADYTMLRDKRIELMDAFIKEHGVEAKTGIFELLDFLDNRGIPAAITSSSPSERIEAHLSSLSLYHRFAKICSGYDMPRVNRRRTFTSRVPLPWDCPRSSALLWKMHPWVSSPPTGPDASR